MTTPEDSARSSNIGMRAAGRMKMSANRARDSIEKKNENTFWGKWKTLSNQLETLLEKPESGPWAYGLAWTIVGMIGVSTFCFCAETVPSLEAYDSIWHGSEIFFVIVFSLEYTIRFIVTSKGKMNFILDTSNMIDAVAILPFYISLLFTMPISDLRVIRVFRLMRVFKLIRFSQDLQFIVQGISSTRTAFFLLGFLLMLALIFFSFLMWFFERGAWDAKLNCYVRPGEVHFTGCSPYQSVPDSLWWAVTTLTTVGYGDTFPLSGPGRAICGVSMVTGILCIALPTTHLGVEFAGLYEEKKAA